MSTPAFGDVPMLDPNTNMLDPDIVPISTATQNALNAKANASSLAAKADKPANGGTLVQGNAGVVYKIHGFVPAGGAYPPAPDPSDADKVNIFLLEMP